MSSIPLLAVTPNFYEFQGLGVITSIGGGGVNQKEKQVGGGFILTQHGGFSRKLISFE
jgi:hypothetical protein